ncbi:MAG: hypothetical protein ABH826_02470 [Patescibacteria group bacterium]|nr:hypothetical protein [Patescibacteria group bacterium]
MKKILLFAVSLALVGAGCLGGGNKTVEGDWVLAFDLPKEWVMVAPYSLDSPIDLEKQIERTDSEVWLQSTPKLIYQSSGFKPNDETIAEAGLDWDEDVVTQEYSQIVVTYLDSRRLIPEGAEDLGNGFYKFKLCEDDEDCRIGGAYNYEYYLVTQDAKFKFQVSGEVNKVEDIIFSAEETTVPEVDYGFSE